MPEIKDILRASPISYWKVSNATTERVFNFFVNNRGEKARLLFVPCFLLPTRISVNEIDVFRKNKHWYTILPCCLGPGTPRQNNDNTKKLIPPDECSVKRHTHGAILTIYTELYIQ